MKDEDKTKEQLIDELVELRQRIAELETNVRKSCTQNFSGVISRDGIYRHKGWVHHAQLKGV